jgi:hypothetical protein
MCNRQTCHPEVFAEIRTELAAGADAQPPTAPRTSSSIGADATRPA